MEGFGDTHKLKPQVEWQGRAPMSMPEKICGGLFYVQLLLQLSMGFAMIGMKNVILLPEGDCGDDYVRRGGVCVKQSLMDEYAEKCYGSNGRRLSWEDTRTLWDALDEFPGVPLLLVLCMVVLAMIWLKVLQKCARPVVWSTIFLTQAFLLYAAIRPLTIEGGSFGWGFIVIFLGVAGWAIYKRKAFDNAAKVISHSCTGLSETPSIFLWSFVVLAMQGAYVGVWACFMVQSAAVWEVNTDDGACDLKSAKASDNMRIVLGVLFWPTAYFFQNACMIVCATGMGRWYFHNDDQNAPTQGAFEGFKWAFTISSGASFFCAIVMTIVNWCRRQANSHLKWCFCCFPFHMLAFLLWQCFGQVVQAFTRFMLISHTFHGGGIQATATNSFDVLKRRLGDAVTTDMVASMVLSWSTALFSTAFGFAAWAWLDNCLEMGLLNTVGDAAAESGEFADILVLFLIIVMWYFVSNPLLSLIILAIFGSMIKSGMLVGFLGGVFIGSICCLFFRFFSSVVLNSADTIFYAFALEADAGQRQPRFEKIYDMIENVLVVGTPVTNAANHGNTGTNTWAGAPVAVVPMQQMTVQCPPDGVPGSLLVVTAPNGTQCQVAVPAGVNPGDAFVVQVPGGDSPLVQAAVMGKEVQEASKTLDPELPGALPGSVK